MRDHETPAMIGTTEEGRGLPLTRPFHDLVRKRIVSDPAFDEALLRESIDAMLTGDVDSGKAISGGHLLLRDRVFDALRRK
jgi:hypothetical protein